MIEFSFSARSTPSRKCSSFRDDPRPTCRTTPSPSRLRFAARAGSAWSARSCSRSSPSSSFPWSLDPEPRRDRAEPVLSIPPKDDAPPLTAARPLRPCPPRARPPRASGGTADDPPPRRPRAPAPVERRRRPSSRRPRRRRPRAGRGHDAGPAGAEARRASPSRSAPSGTTRSSRRRARSSNAAKIAHYTERLDGSGGELTRLRAGPFPTREAADKAAAQLKRAGLDVARGAAAVRRLQPARFAPTVSGAGAGHSARAKRIHYRGVTNPGLRDA